MSKYFIKSETGKAVIFVVVILAIVGAIAFISLRDSGTPVSALTAESGPAQEINMIVTSQGYQPSVLTVSPGQHVRWVIDASRAQGCIRSLVVPTMRVNKLLAQGQNVIEFTAPQSGSIPFSCSMGMYRGVINVQ